MVNGKVDGRVTELDVGNTSISISNIGVITISTTNPAVVPTERATDIQRGLNAFTHATGIIAAHELGHGLGLIAQTNHRQAHIAVPDVGIFLSPLAGDASEHNVPPVGELMDPGPAVSYRTIFAPGARMPLGNSNRRYLLDCFPAAQ